MHPSRITLKPGHDKPVATFHPWVFAKAIDAHGGASAGDMVEVFTAAGRFVGRGCFNPDSAIAVRIWTWLDEAIDDTFFQQRIGAALTLRRQLGFAPQPDAAFRLVNAEADFLPGVVVDLYGEFAVVQLQSLGAELHRAPIIAALSAHLPLRGIYERSDVATREREGLAQRVGVLAGEPPPDRLEIREDDTVFLVDIRHGQKTGFYLDQRENRAILARVAAGLHTPGTPPLQMLNAFSYTGGFGVCLAATVNAQVLNIDSSADALAAARENYARNGVNEGVDTVCGNVFGELRRLRDAARSFDVIVLDPPKLAATRGQLAGACRGYKDLNLLALKLLRPGGLLATFSCSGALGSELFQQVLAGAAADAGVPVQILRHLGAAADHPVLLAFPEGTYLKGLLLRLQTTAPPLEAHRVE